MSGWNTGLATFATFAAATTAAATGESHYQLVTPGPPTRRTRGDVSWLVRGLERAPDTDAAGRCVCCEAPRDIDPAWCVFTEEQLREATAFCRVCGWPEFESDGATYQRGNR